uniref:Uncharacterized protein n=1 Tax=Arundo donax TaxID=35708 RepID=A0A0A9F1N5_ARUDO
MSGRGTETRTSLSENSPILCPQKCFAEGFACHPYLYLLQRFLAYQCGQ